MFIVSQQLKSATHESSCAMTLNCISSNFTSCFITSSTPDLNHCKCHCVLVMKSWRDVFAAFLTWIVTRILRLLASEQCSPLHPKALECFNNILHVCCMCKCVMYTDMSICTNAYNEILYVYCIMVVVLLESILFMCHFSGLVTSARVRLYMLIAISKRWFLTN